MAEIEGKTLEEAIEKASIELQVPKERLEIEVISNEGSKIFGLMGGKRVKIKAEIKEVSKSSQAKKILEDLISFLGVEAAVEVLEERDEIGLNIKSENSGLLIGRRGKTIDALQYLLNKMVKDEGGDKRRIAVDTENYQNRRRASLTNLALRLGKKAKRLKEPVATLPLSPHDRRIVYLALQKDYELSAKSQGEGWYQEVVISPKTNKDD